jgi:hypothetical protein
MLTPEQFVAALADAFSGPVPDRDPAWRGEDLSEAEEAPTDAASAIESPVFELSHLMWEQVDDFLWCGQSYE